MNQLQTLLITVTLGLSGHKQTTLLELAGYGHGMTEPAFPLLLEELKRVGQK